MLNVLTFPTTLKRAKKRESAFEMFTRFLKNIKKRREEIYQEKIKFLNDECYKFYLKKFLKERHQAQVVDFPDFMYWQRSVICQEAVYISRLVVSVYEEVYGRRFIEKCYKRQFNKLKKSITK